MVKLLDGASTTGWKMTEQELLDEYLKTIDFSYSERHSWPTIQEAFLAGLRSSEKPNEEEE